VQLPFAAENARVLLPDEHRTAFTATKDVIAD
jgi:hypothetical protein